VSAKPETTFINALHRKLPTSVYHMKNNNPYTGGIPDLWYSGQSGDVWVEYKFLPTMPVRADVHPAKLLSALQMEWLNGRYAEGRNVAVIIGAPKGGVLLVDRAWEMSLSPQLFASLIRSKDDLIEWILTQVN